MTWQGGAAAAAFGIAIAGLALATSVPAVAKSAADVASDVRATAPSGAAPTAPSAPDGAALTLEFIDRALADNRLQAAGTLLARARARADSPELQLRMAELYLASGQHAAAEAAFQRLEAAPELAARAMAGRGLSLLQRGDVNAAQTVLQTAVARDPTVSRGWSALAVIASQKRDWATAEALYATALQLAPDSAVLFNNRGYARLQQRLLPAAQADFERALQLQPGLAVAETNLRLARAMAGDYAASLASSDPRSLGQNLNIAGYGALLRGDLPRAESYFARAVDAAPAYRPRAAANLDYVVQLQQAAKAPPAP